jgi:hypothetical protein
MKLVPVRIWEKTALREARFGGKEMIKVGILACQGVKRAALVKETL